MIQLALAFFGLSALWMATGRNERARRRAHDLDNCLARMKSGLDGLADVLGVDDKAWSLTISKSDEVGGMVRVEVSECCKKATQKP